MNWSFRREPLHGPTRVARVTEGPARKREDLGSRVERDGADRVGVDRVPHRPQDVRRHARLVVLGVEVDALFPGDFGDEDFAVEVALTVPVTRMWSARRLYLASKVRPLSDACWVTVALSTCVTLPPTRDAVSAKSGRNQVSSNQAVP